MGALPRPAADLVASWPRWEDLLIASMAVAYITIIHLFHVLNGTYAGVRLYFYAPSTMIVAAVISVAFIAVKTLEGQAGRYCTIPSLVSTSAIVFLAVGFRTAFASHKQSIPTVHPFSWDESFQQLDRIIHFGRYPHELLSALSSRAEIVKWVDAFYMTWFLILFGSCVLAAWSSRRRLRLQFFISTMCVFALLGTGLGTLFSSVGPCYYGRYVAGFDPYEAHMAELRLIDATSTLSAIRNQARLWENHVTGGWLPFGGISAMPSVHVAMAVVFALAAWRIDGRLGVVFTGFALIIQIGSVLLGWHYAIDGYVSAVLTLVIWALVGKCVRKVIPAEA
jgi:hypothetical protein